MTKTTPEGLPRVKSYFKYDRQFYFTPKLVFNFVSNNWQLHYSDGDKCFHYGYNQNFWEAKTLPEVIEKAVAYFNNTPQEIMYQFHK